MYDNLGKRANDLTKVFEQKYKANSYKHNGFKETQNREKEFQKKMLGIKNIQDNTRKVDGRVKSSGEMQLERLNQNLANLNNNRW